MPLEQHGLRDHSCLEMVLTKTFFNDMIKQKFWDSAEGSFDAHTCYDRAVYNYVGMSWQAFGVPLCVAICMLMAIQLMKNFLQTSQMDSITMYGEQRDKKNPFQDLCQGNGAGLAGWVGVSSMLL